MSFQNSNENTCCEPGCCSSQSDKDRYCCSSECCSSDKEGLSEKRKIVLDFLYLDLGVCTRCQGTDNSIDEAIKEVANVLETIGMEIKINKIYIDSMEKAEKYQFESSPTIRINGKDIQLEVKKAYVNLVEICVVQKLIVGYGFIKARNTMFLQKE